ncbi:aminotransferase [Roseovarius sp. TE539]|uniref:cysteine desulfurase family protein n=1 Tax=Roseovarius sp. TE539 TaxID=2249812 RepID=UPI000DDEF0C7|nr:cysteine desulfurase family protein [Roseovarius sp. TE539]RBI72261.1 aminotransferase [Roseovarius sp. TE539]
MSRIYMDWNATAPLRPEAREAMIAAMDLPGNPSSVHEEGRAARGLIESARARIAEAVGAGDADIVFTSGATEAAALACAGRDLEGAAVEHDALRAWVHDRLPVSSDGHVTVAEPSRSVLQAANSETGVIQELPPGLAVSDLTQAFGKVPLRFDDLDCDMGLVSAHKLGGPKGIGALILRPGLDVSARIRGGGQEMGRRSGTENLPGIAGFAAAATAAMRDLREGVWERVAEFRKILENSIAAASKETIFVGKRVARLPNTSCFVTPGWKGETQVMRMDLAGFAVSAGSACSSGKVRASTVLQAMGLDPEQAGCALRVSLGPRTREEDITSFAREWAELQARHRARAA